MGMGSEKLNKDCSHCLPLGGGRERNGMFLAKGVRGITLEMERI